MFQKIIAENVQLLSKEKDTEYMDYVYNVSRNPIASEVKYCDLKNNTDLSRSNGKIVVSEWKWERYQESLKLLNDLYGFE